MKKFEEPQRMNILLVEDNEHDRTAFHRAFHDVGDDCLITECVRASEALSLIEKDPSAFDVVVIDHHLSCQFGLDLCKELLAASVPHQYRRWPLPCRRRPDHVRQTDRQGNVLGQKSRQESCRVRLILCLRRQKKGSRHVAPATLFSVFVETGYIPVAYSRAF